MEPIELQSNRVIILDNISCPFCGVDLKGVKANQDHIIGRRFIPIGFLEVSWNLKVNSCYKCNNTKSVLENDISAITLFDKALHQHDDLDTDLLQEIKRKASRSKSLKTDLMVKDSIERIETDFVIKKGIKLRVGFTAKPQIEPERVFELARLQLMGFFYFISYNPKIKKGGFWIEGFYPLSVNIKKDWGAPLQKQFMEKVESWCVRFYGTAAKGFFRVIIRKHPVDEIWSWAVEWNKSYRVIGFFGSEAKARLVISSFNHYNMKFYESSDGEIWGLREDVPLKDEDDILFYKASSDSK